MDGWMDGWTYTTYNFQVILGLPFLTTYPMSYITRSFDMSRVFLYKWTVIWKFLPEYIFLSRPFHIILLCGHVTMLLIFIKTKWMK